MSEQVISAATRNESCRSDAQEETPVAQNLTVDAAEGCAGGPAGDSAAVLAFVDDAFNRHPDSTGRLLNVLNDVQEQYRYLPEEAIGAIAERMDVSTEQIMRMGEFFNYLSLEPVGRCIIDVCDGTACHTLGSARLVAEFEKKLGIKVGQTTNDGLITLRTAGCVGACGIAPVVVVEGEAYGRVRVTQVGDIAAAAIEQAEQGQDGEA